MNHMLSDAEAKVLKGALGLWYADKPYRSHYRAPAAGSHRELLDGMAAKGLMEQAKPGSDYFYVTDAGAAAMGHTLPPNP